MFSLLSKTIEITALTVATLIAASAWADPVPQGTWREVRDLRDLHLDFQAGPQYLNLAGGGCLSDIDGIGFQVRENRARINHVTVVYQNGAEDEVDLEHGPGTDGRAYNPGEGSGGPRKIVKRGGSGQCVTGLKVFGFTEGPRGFGRALINFRAFKQIEALPPLAPEQFLGNTALDTRDMEGGGTLDRSTVWIQECGLAKLRIEAKYKAVDVESVRVAFENGDTQVVHFVHNIQRNDSRALDLDGIFNRCVRSVTFVGNTTGSKFESLLGVLEVYGQHRRW